jgi:parvulin-like peptidyl-prolyl isomerase
MTEVIQLGNIWQQTVNNLNNCASAEILQLLEKYQILPHLIKEMVLDQAIASISCTAEEEKTASEKLAQQLQITSDDARQRWLEQNNLSADKFRAIAIRQLQIEKFKHHNWGSHIESYFTQRQPQLNQVVYSLIRTTDMGMAQEIYFRLEAGEQSFAELAKEYSQGPEAQTNGIIGPIELQKLHPALAKILITSQPQQLLPPIQIESLIVIARLEKFIRVQLDNSLRQRLLNELFQTWLKAQITPPNHP